MNHGTDLGREGITGPGFGAWESEHTRASDWSLLARPSIEVRRLTERDHSRLASLLEQDPGFGLFMASNLAAYGLNAGFVRYWGAFVSGELRSALMMVGRRAMLYALPGLDVQPLAHVAASEGFDFTMGRTDLVDALVGDYPTSQCGRREEHHLAELTQPAVLAAQRPVPPGVVVRRATPADLDELAHLYYQSDGFEELAENEVRRAMASRVRGNLRTYVAEVEGRLLAGASTSAEAPSAAMIGGVWTTTTARNRGLSTAVVAALSRELLAERRRVYLFYLMDNAPAARVYAKCGFHPVGRWSVVYLRP